jgi:hypothetical protein
MAERREAGLRFLPRMVMGRVISHGNPGKVIVQDRVT